MYDKYHNKIRKENLTLIFGTNDLSNNGDVIGKLKIGVDKVTVHEKWNPINFRFNDDIAILKLIEDVTFSKYVQPICLVTDNSLMINITRGKVAGWGKSEDYGNSVDIARIVNLEIQELVECFIENPLLAKIAWTKAFCAKSEDKGVCEGDSGSGLYVKIGDKFFLKGLVSSSIQKECSEKSTALYTDIIKYYNFIKVSINK